MVCTSLTDPSLESLRIQKAFAFGEMQAWGNKEPYVHAAGSVPARLHQSLLLFAQRSAPRFRKSQKQKRALLLTTGTLVSLP